MRARALGLALAGFALACAGKSSTRPVTAAKRPVSSSSPHAASAASPYPPFSDPAAVAAGRELAARLFGRDPLSADTRLLRYVALVGRTCAGAGAQGWRFAVTQSTIPYATAFPGRLVVISRGLLVLVHSEAELAVVLSREICRGETSPARDFPGPAQEEAEASGEASLDACGARLASRAGYDAAAFLRLVDTLQDRAASAREKSDLQAREQAYRALPEFAAGGKLLAERFRSSAIM
jgi:predicted Zn-dependent protease